MGNVKGALGTLVDDLWLLGCLSLGVVEVS